MKDNTKENESNKEVRILDNLDTLKKQADKSLIMMTDEYENTKLTLLGLLKENGEKLKAMETQNKVSLDTIKQQTEKIDELKLQIKSFNK